LKLNDLKSLKEPTFLNLAELAIRFSDGIIIGSKTLKPELDNLIKKSSKPVLNYSSPEEYIDQYSVFYDKILTGSE
jgi:starch synthase